MRRCRRKEPVEEKDGVPTFPISAASSNELLMQLGRRPTKMPVRGVTETVAFDNISHSVYNPTFDSLRSGRSSVVTAGTLFTDYDIYLSCDVS